MIVPLSAACVAALADVSTSALATLAPATLGGTLLGGVIGNRADGILCKLVGGAANRFVKNARAPENHDLLKGMVTAHARAFTYYAETLQTQGTNPSDHIVAKKVAALANKRLSEDADVADALIGIVTPLIAREGDLDLDTRRKQLIDAAAAQLRAWIEQETKETLPPHFAALLTEPAPNGRASWHAVFQLYLSELIKTQPRFERIFMAGNIAELVGRTISIQEIAETMADELGDIRDQLSGLTQTLGLVGQTTDRIEQKQDEMFALLRQVAGLTTLGLETQDVEMLVSLASEQDIPATEIVPYFKRLIAATRDKVDGDGVAQDWVPVARDAVERDLMAPDGSGALQQVTLDWLDRYVVPAVRSRSNPYKELAHFDVADGGQFHGRDEEVTQAQAVVTDILAGTCAPAGLCIGGISGTGKSSFLRAGVLGRIVTREDCAIVVLRPEDLSEDLGVPASVLGAVIDQQPGLPIPAQALSRCTRVTGPQAVELVCDAIAHAASAAGRKLVFAFDQLEEVVDYWASDGPAYIVERRFWAPLFGIMAGIAARGQACVLYTLESNRATLITRCHASAIFDQAQVARIELTQPRTSFFSEIIRGPFEAADYHLSPAVVRALLDEVESLERHDSDAPARAILPLLSLKLAKLFDFVDQRFAPVPSDRLNRVRPELPDSGFITPDGLATDGEAFDFAIGNEIGLLASAAWRRATGQEQPDFNDLDFFVPFVGTTDGADLLQLRAVRRSTIIYQEPVLRALSKARLLEESQGRYRLIHEAVLREWKPASDWLERRLPTLQSASRLRAQAKQWADDGRSPLHAVDQSLVSDAGEILVIHLRQWSISLVQLEPDDALLRDYCLEVFSHVDSATVLRDGRTGLSLAASYGRVDLVKRLAAESPAAISIRSGPHGRTPLAAAAWAHPDVVEILLDAGADPYDVDTIGFPPISSAIWGGQDRTFRLLLTAIGHNPVKTPSGSLLHDCAAAGQLEMCKHLVTSGIGDPAERNAAGELPIQLAASRGHREVFLYLASINDPFEPDDYGMTCWHTACSTGQLHILEEIADLPDFAGREADAANSGQNGLHMAAYRHHSAVVGWLLRFPGLNRPVENNGRIISTPLTLAIEQRGTAAASYQAEILQTVRALLAHPDTDLNAFVPDPNNRQQKGTALSLAADLPLVQSELLADHRLNLVAQRPGDGNPLEIAAQRGWWNALRAMLTRIDTDDALGAANNPLEFFAGLRAVLPDDILDMCLAKWPLSAELAGNLIGPAVQARNAKLANLLLQRAGILTGSHRHVLLSAVALGMDVDFVDTLAARIPSAWSLPYWGGWTVLHRLCAAQSISALTTYADSIAKDPAAWTARDRVGRVPADLIAPERRDLVSGPPPSDYSWPDRGSWDMTLTWQPADEAQRGGALAMMEAHGYTEDTCSISAAYPDFYPSTVALLRVQRIDGTASDATLYGLHREGSIYRLPGLSLPIHQMNELAPLALPPEALDRVADYIRFFGYFVRGVHGPFLIYEQPGQTGYPPDLTVEEQEFLPGLSSTPLSVYDPDRDLFCVMANIIYGNAGFACDFEVQRLGLVDMVRDMPITPNLSSSPDSPIAPRTDTAS